MHRDEGGGADLGAESEEFDLLYEKLKVAFELPRKQ
jgi:hypothetical protein